MYIYINLIKIYIYIENTKIGYISIVWHADEEGVMIFNSDPELVSYYILNNNA